MYLQRIQLNGFKSFVDKTNIDLGPGITCIIGPNGSGKSNIADAMRWVLGEQSAKSLRGTKMEDVIFAGSKNRKPVGRAEVSITLDNSNRIFPLDYSEITVTRRVYRSGESQYLINKVPCRLKDVQELFMDTGVGKDAFAIIGQGKVDWIISSSSEERRPLFEEVAGITKYRYRKKEALSKLEKTGQNLTRINDILSELEVQLGPLAKEAKKAQIYLNKKKELDEKEIKVQLIFLKNSQEELKRVRNDLEQLEDKLLLYDQEDNILTALNERIGLQIMNVEEKIKLLMNMIQRLEEEKSNLLSEKRVLEEQVRGLDTQVSSLDKNLYRYEEEKKKLHKQLIEKEKSLFLCQKKIKQCNVEINIIENQLSCIEDKIHDREENINSVNSNQIEELNKLASLKTDISNYEQHKKFLEVQYEKTNNLVQNKTVILKNLEQQINDKLIEIENMKKTLEKTEQNIEKLKNEKNILKEQQSSLFEEQSKISTNIQQLTSRYKALKEMYYSMEGYNKGVKSILVAKKNGHKACSGVLGVVAEIIEVPSEYELAIETALGGALQNIITYKDEDAKKAISYLKMISGGRATFLPLNSVKPRPLEQIDKLKRLDGVLGLASELVKYDNIYKPAVDYLLGRVLVAEDVDKGLKIAKQTKYSYKIVTLEGEIFHPGGLISGGKVKNNKTGILGRSRKLRELKDEEVKQKKKYEIIINKINLLQKKIEQIEEQEKDLVTKTENMNFKISQINHDINIVTEKKKEIERELEVIELENKKHSMEIQQLEEKEKELEKKLKKAELKQENYSKIIQKYRKESKELLKEKESLNNNLAKIRVQLGSLQEQESGLKQFMNDIQNRMDNLNSTNLNIQEQKQNLIAKKESILNNIDQMKKQSEEIILEIKKLNFIIKKLIKISEPLGKKQVFIEKRIKEIYKEKQLVNNNIRKIEVRQAKLETGIEGAFTTLKKDYGITPGEEDFNINEDPNTKELKRDIQRLKEEIRLLGEINIGAIDQFNQLKERYSFLNDQKQDLIKASNELKEVISQIENIMEKRFLETFSQVNRNFEEIFHFLFNGGRAYLSLNDRNNPLETGINIEAQPPGKKLQNINLLSGGEKALTAIALLFAFLKVKPSPFCILDEIEASLDDSNVKRFAQFLRSFSKETQFLVISHRQPTMEEADVLYGITMEEPGVSKLISIKLEDHGVASSA